MFEKEIIMKYVSDRNSISQLLMNQYMEYYKDDFIIAFITKNEIFKIVREYINENSKYKLY